MESKKRLSRSDSGRFLVPDRPMVVMRNELPERLVATEVSVIQNGSANIT